MLKHVCGDAGLVMAFEYALQYFIGDPVKRRLPEGSPCPRCASTTAALWHTQAGDVKCLARLAIDDKRPGVKTAEGHSIPHSGERGFACFGAGSMIIAGPHVSRVVTKLRPARPLPAHVTLVFSASRSITKELRGLFRDPPKPPFVVLRFDQKAVPEAKITTSTDRIYLNGADGPVLVERTYLLELVDLLDGLPPSRIADILRLRMRLAAGSTDEADVKALDALRAEHPKIVAAFRRLLSTGGPAYTALNYLLQDE